MVSWMQWVGKVNFRYSLLFGPSHLQADQRMFRCKEDGWMVTWLDGWMDDRWINGWVDG